MPNQAPEPRPLGRYGVAGLTAGVALSGANHMGAAVLVVTGGCMLVFALSGLCAAFAPSSSQRKDSFRVFEAMLRR